jgi:predicted membrane protein
MIALHVISALFGLGLATYLFFNPQKFSVITSYFNSILVVATGTLLVVTANAGILKTCLIGMAYLTIVLAITVRAHHGLVTNSN